MTDRVTRVATDGERVIIEGMFGAGSIDFSSAKISNFAVIPTTRPHAPFGQTHFPSGYHSDFSKASIQI